MVKLEMTPVKADPNLVHLRLLAKDFNFQMIRICTYGKGEKGITVHSTGEISWTNIPYCT